MKRSIYAIILVITSLIWIKCDNVNSELKFIEQIVEEHPQSALELINKIPNPNKLSEYDKSLYALLKIQAMDKCDIDITEDTLIYNTANYFLLNNDSINAAKSLFYCGKISHNLLIYNRSTSYYLKAYNLINNKYDNKYRYLISNYLGISYYEQGKYDEGLKVWHEALMYANISDNNLYKSIALTNIGAGYLYKMSEILSKKRMDFPVHNNIKIQNEHNSFCDSAIYYLRQAYDYRDDSSCVDIYEKLAQSYMFKNNQDSAFFYSDIAINSINNKDEYIIGTLIDRAYLYNNLNNPDSARKILYDCISGDNDVYSNISINYGLLKSYELFHNKDSIIKYLYNYNSLTDKKNELEKSLVGYTFDMIEKYHLSETENINFNIKNSLRKRTILIMCMFGFFTIVIIIILFFSYRMKKDKEKAILLAEVLKEKENRAREQMIISQKMNDYFSLRNKYSQVLLKYFIGINFSDTTDNLMLNENHWEKIVGTVSETYNDLPRKLSNQYKRLTTEDIRIFCLLLLRLKQEDIAKFTGRTPATISLRLSRMKEKMDISKENEWHEIIEEILNEYIDVNQM